MNKKNARELAELIARKVFEIGGTPNSPCQRIQFLGGSYLYNEIKQGGLCKAALLKFIEETLIENT